MNNAQDLYLYKRDGAYIPRIAAVHDLCGYGKCSLGVAIPVLSAAGCDVCPVPTSLFSAHTRFPVFHMHDTTDMLSPYLDAWNAEGIELDAIYSGFLGAAEQVGAIQRLYREHSQALRIVDPVMGDGGKQYPTYTDELCAAMGDLVNGADVLTPNLTEACFLADEPYRTDFSDAELAALCEKLAARHAGRIVISGIPRDDTLVNFIYETGCGTSLCVEPRIGADRSGTGDVFASVILADAVNGVDFATSVRKASAFVASAVRIPLTAIVMVAEISGNHELLLPAMWVCGISFWLNNGWTLYRSQVHCRESSPVHE